MVDSFIWLFKFDSQNFRPLRLCTRPLSAYNSDTRTTTSEHYWTKNGTIFPWFSIGMSAFHNQIFFISLPFNYYFQNFISFTMLQDHVQTLFVLGQTKSERALTFINLISFQINTVYNCNEHCSNQILCQRNGYQNPNSCYECLCPEPFAGSTNCEDILPSNSDCGGTIFVRKKLIVSFLNICNSGKYLYDFWKRRFSHSTIYFSLW